MAVFDPLSRYRADSTAYQAIDLVPGTAGVITVSGLSSVDDASVAIDLGSNVFRFYGASFSGNNKLYISSNGLISFGGADPSAANDNLYGGYLYGIAPLWDNWVTNRDTSPNDLVLYQFRDLNGDSVADQLVIEWNNVYHAEVPESDGATFQAILSLNTGAGNGDIVFNYVDLAVDGGSGDSNYNDGGNASIGISSGQPGTQGTQLLVGVNGEADLPVSSGTAIRITTVPNPISPNPTLIKDINTTRIGSAPSQLTVFNGALYFFADNGYSGYELNKVDAAGNVSLVKDINVGPNGSQPLGLTVVGSNLFFQANDPINGYGLWRSDGSETGTTLVKGGLEGYAYNDASSVAASGGKFFFKAYDGANGIELWVSDGTAVGTIRISNIEAGAGNSNPANLTDVNGTLFFAAITSAGGTELYKTNGTLASTALVKAIASGAASSDPQELINFNGALYFTANDGASGRELWRSGGTSATTAVLRNINTNAGAGSDPVNLTILNNTLYFFANSGAGYQLWKSDGTSAGTVRVSTAIFNKDYYTNYSFNLFNLNGTLYFTSQGAVNTELWKSNGTTVTKVADLPSYYSLASDFTNVGGILYFSLSDGGVSTGKELWKSNGTAEGTELVRDIASGPSSSNPRELTAFNNQLYFVAASDPQYYPDELWSSDGTSGGTRSLEVNPATQGANISDPLLFNGKLYFAANDGVAGKELWTSDGTAAGTQLVKDVREGINGDIRALTAMGSNLYFFAYDDLNGYGLWKSDGSGAGTVLVSVVDSFSYGYSEIINAGNRIYFRGLGAGGEEELWTSDGTGAGTGLVKDIYPGSGSSSPDLFKQALLGNTLFFIAANPDSGVELWKTNGTDASTSLVRDIYPGADWSTPDDLIVFNGAVYFDAYDPTYGRELWKTDGINTTRVKNIAAGATGSDPQNYVVFQGNLFFSAYDPTNGWELWKTDGTTAGTVRVSDLPSGSPLFQSTVVNNTLFFTRNGYELWKTDGTSAGTTQMSGAPGASLGSTADLKELTNVNGVLYFAATDSTYGRELWRSDGTAEGTYRVTDLNAKAPLGSGLGNSNPRNLIYDASRNKLFFTASNWQSGGEYYGENELFSLDINERPTDLSLSVTTFNENVAAASVVGSFSTTDPDTANTFTYSLVAGSGATDNGAFTLVGNQLQINASPDFETKNSYSIRVRSTDQGGLSFEKALSIGINNVNEAPTDLALSGSGTVNENAGPALVLGSLSSIDPDSPTTPQSFTYNLVSGTGDSDNAAFSVVANQLLLNASADFETKSSYSLRLRSTDQGGLFTEKVLTIAVNNLNDAPTDLGLSASSVNENVAANSVIGSFNSTDQDAGNTFTYSLVAGSGATDNGAFNILGNQLRINAIPNFETKSSFSIRVRSTDQSGAFVEKVLPISILNVNETPTNISLSASSVIENVAAGSLVGTLSSTDPDAPLTPQSFGYRLVAGTGDTDNAAFEIQENELRLRATPDFELKSSYSIRLQTRDQGNRTFAKVFTITVTSQAEAPTDLALSASSLDENVAAGTVVGSLSSTDQDAGNTFSYSLVAGTGATDNGAFTIVGNQLQINTSPDFETKNSYSIRVRSTDQGGLSFEKALSIGINNVNEAPTDLALSGSGTVNENAGPALVLGSLSSIDPDSPTTPQSFTYNLVSGTGDSDNAAFSVVANQLLLNASADFETKSSYSLRLRSTDQGGLFTEKVLTIAVNNLNDAPTDLGLSASSVNENVAANSVIGSFNSTDQDAGNTFTYSLVAGSGATDNGAFNILGNQLRINAIPNFETKSSFSIRVRSTDQSGAFVEKVLPISILNVNETPTNISLSASSVIENVAAGSLVGTLSSTDPDAPLTPQSFGYRLVAGTGDTDNAAFEIQENELRLRATPDFELKSSYSIRLQTRDQGNRTFAKVFTITVTNVNEAPTSSTDFFTATTAVDALQGLSGNDGFFVGIDALNSGDSFDGGADVDQMIVSGGSSTQLLTIDLNQANQFVSLTNGAAFGTTPIFTGFEDVNLSGFAGAGVLTGNSEANRFTASARKDILTGNAGADTFALNSLGHSLLTAFDVITDYSSADLIDAPGAIAATLTTSSGNATSLSNSAIAAVLTSAAFPANSARAFTVTGQSGTFLALNNATAGFSSTTDAILHLSGYTIGVANPITVL
jgi:ELWxxDGT repeat protein